MPIVKDMIGAKVGRLTVICQGDWLYEPSGRRKVTWVCRCECGATTQVRASALRSRGNTSSCGCLQRQLSKERLTTHGKYAGPEYRTWNAMLARCNNPKNIAWSKYGARGVQVCKQWRYFANFLKDMGPRPAGTSIDRVDVLKGYEPGNCRWATNKEQCAHRRPKGTVT